VIRREIVVVLVVLALMWTSSARAQKADSKKRAALVLLTQGNALFGKGDYQAALDLFRQAYATFPSPNILPNIGTALKALGRKIEAADIYQKYLDTGEGRQATRKEVRQALTELDRDIAKLQIQCDSTGAEVFVDSRSLGKCERLMVVRVADGTRQVRAQDGGRQASVDALATLGETTEVRLLLSARKPAPQPSPAPTARPVPRPAERVAAHEEAQSPLAGQGELVVASRHSSSRRFRGMVLAEVDYKGRGAAAFVAAGYQLGRHIGLSAGALVGGEAIGMYAGATWAPLDGTLHPRLGAGVPIFVSNGARLAVRVSAGVEWWASQQLGFVLDVGLERYVNPEAAFKSTVVVPIAGAQLGF